MYRTGRISRRAASSGAWPCSSTRCAPRTTGASGDFGDLRELLGSRPASAPASSASARCTRCSSSDPLCYSPYSASSRHALNVMFIDVAAVLEVQGSRRAQAIMDDRGFSRAARRGARRHAGRLSGRRDSQIHGARGGIRTVPHASTSRAQQRARVRVPRTSCASAASRCGCTRCSMHSTPGCGATRHRRGVAQLARGIPRSRRRSGEASSPQEHADEVDFHGYLQWIASEQLGAVRALARELKLSVGVYGDYAVGVNASGSETWSDQSLYCMGAAIGAPPDPIGVGGQEWGIPPQDPRAVAAHGVRAVRRAGAREHAQLRRVAARSRDGAVPPVVGAARFQIGRWRLRALSTR